jgi:hypothetical protein
MLDCSAQNLMDEAYAAEQHARKHLEVLNQIIETYVGSYYRSDMKPVFPAPENYPYSYVANVRPRLIFNCPRFTASNEGTYLDAKKLLGTAKFVNQWAVNERLHQTLIPAVTQALMMRCVFLTSFEDLEGEVSEGDLRLMLPKCKEIELRRYFRDPKGTPAVKPRYKGHMWVRDLEDVKKLKGVDSKVLHDLVPDIGLDKLERPDQRQGNREGPPRNEIVAYEIWVPECNTYRTNPKLQHGTIFTVAVGQKVHSDGTRERGEKAGFLRKPRPYFGPDWGPYTEIEFVDVPANTYGSSPVAMLMQQVEELNAHLSATADAAARMKHLIFVDAAHDTLALAVQNSPDGHVISIPGVTKEQVIPVLIGGPAPEQYTYNEVARERLDRNIGMDSAQRGGVEQDRTATATNVRYQSLNIRMVDLKRTVANAVKQIANTVAWYGWNSPNVVMRLGQGAGKDFGVKNPVFLGGPDDGEKLPDWDAAALELEAYSMEAPDEEKLAAEVAEALAIVTEMAQIMQEAPWIAHDVILMQLAKLRKFDWLPECINSRLFAEWMKEQVQQNIESHQGEQELQAVQVEAAKTEVAKLKLELATMMQALQRGGEAGERKPPSVSMSYKDLPEDVKRQAEEAAGFSPSTQPLTSPAHVANAMKLHSDSMGRLHDKSMQNRQQVHESKESRTKEFAEERRTRLSGMFKGMAGQKPKTGMKRAAQTGGKAFAASKR